MDKSKIDHYNSSVKYLVPVLILFAFLTASQDIPCGEARPVGGAQVSCDHSGPLFTKKSEEFRLAKRPNLTQRGDGSVCESCHSELCRGLVKFSMTLFPESYTIAETQCLNFQLSPWPVDPLMLPPQDLKVNPKSRDTHPILSRQVRILEATTKI